MGAKQQTHCWFRWLSICNQRTKIKDVSPKVSINNTVKGRLYNSNGASFDFENSEIVVDELIVDDEIQIPYDVVKNHCCQTYIETLDDGTDRGCTKILKSWFYRNCRTIRINDS